MMNLRRAAANLMKRIQPASRPLLASSSISTYPPRSAPGKPKYPKKCGPERSAGRMTGWDSHLWRIIVLQAAITLGIDANLALADTPSESTSEKIQEDATTSGLRRVEDGSVTSNEHTIKWRIFTDSGREHFMQGKLEDAEKLFIAAISEAKEGFGDRDAHVAAACNNLAELYRVKKYFDKAEPLYLQAISILEESFSLDDIRVGAALHNLGLFYLLRQKMVEAHRCYERALKVLSIYVMLLRSDLHISSPNNQTSSILLIKGRVLGHNHSDYADTMYRLGTVLYLEGKVKDAAALIQDSIDILEGAGEGESITCMRRLRYLAQIYTRSHRLQEAENVQRKILHILELLKGWDTLETVIAAEALSLTLQSEGNLLEARELFDRCLDARKSILPAGHLQIGTNMLHIAKVIIMNSDRLRQMPISEAVTELEKAKDHLNASIRISGQVLVKCRKQKKQQKHSPSEETLKEGRAALAILLQSLEALSRLEITRQQLVESKEDFSPSTQSEKELLRCISAFKEFENEGSFTDAPEVKMEYLSCLKHLLNLVSSDETMDESRRARIQELNKTIKQVESDLV